MCYISHSGLKFCHRLTFGDVEIEEITIENSLYDSGDDGDDIEAIFIVVPVDPVKHVKASVGAERKQVVASNRLRLASLTDHKQLRQDGYSLQVN